MPRFAGWLALSLVQPAAEAVYEPEPIYSDAYECQPNNTELTASDLKTSNQYIMNLSVWPAGDEDWFVWRSSKPGVLTVTVYEVRFGQLELSVVGNDGYGGPVEKRSAGPTNVETVTFAVKDAGRVYKICVRGLNGGTSKSYTLDVGGEASDGTWNQSPWTQPSLVSVIEGTPMPRSNRWRLTGMAIS